MSITGMIASCETTPGIAVLLIAPGRRRYLEWRRPPCRYR
jgi:hypothetical protein